jgi:phosphohistidine phosphatase
MPELLILRHAKSSWKFPTLADHDRPLKKRGRRDAPRIGALMQEEGLIPDLVLCSTACRAKATWRRLELTLPDGAVVEFHDDLYHVGPDDLLDLIRSRAGAAERVLIIGHNPGLEMLVTHLTGEGLVLPTASLVQLEITGEWEQCESARFVRQWKPKEL